MHYVQIYTKGLKVEKIPRVSSPHLKIRSWGPVAHQAHVLGSGSASGLDSSMSACLGLTHTYTVRLGLATLLDPAANMGLVLWPSPIRLCSGVFGVGECQPNTLEGSRNLFMLFNLDIIFLVKVQIKILFHPLVCIDESRGWLGWPQHSQSLELLQNYL